MISIIVPVYNNLPMTMDCLNSIKSNTREGSYEVIVVDNGSDPSFQCPPWAKFAYLRNETNLGFPIAVNQGIKAAKGEVIVLLNNDCIVSQGWLERLLYHLDSYSIVSPVTNYCAGMQLVTIPVYQDEQEFYREAEKWSESHTGESQEVNWIIGFCMAFKKSLWEEIGPFDESLWPCSGEEIIFCLESKKRGYKVAIARDIYIHHFGSQTLNEMNESGQINYLELCNRNDKHIAELYGDDWIYQNIERSE